MFATIASVLYIATISYSQDIYAGKKTAKLSKASKKTASQKRLKNKSKRSLGALSQNAKQFLKKKPKKTGAKYRLRHKTGAQKRVMYSSVGSGLTYSSSATIFLPKVPPSVPMSHTAGALQAQARSYKPILRQSQTGSKTQVKNQIKESIDNQQSHNDQDPQSVSSPMRNSTSQQPLRVQTVANHKPQTIQRTPPQAPHQSSPQTIAETDEVAYEAPSVKVEEILKSIRERTQKSNDQYLKSVSSPMRNSTSQQPLRVQTVANHKPQTIQRTPPQAPHQSASQTIAKTDEVAYEAPSVKVEEILKSIRERTQKSNDQYLKSVSSPMRNSTSQQPLRVQTVANHKPQTIQRTPPQAPHQSASQTIAETDEVAYEAARIQVEEILESMEEYSTILFNQSFDAKAVDCDGNTNLILKLSVTQDNPWSFLGHRSTLRHTKKTKELWDFIEKLYQKIDNQYPLKCETLIIAMDQLVGALSDFLVVMWFQGFLRNLNLKICRTNTTYANSFQTKTLATTDYLLAVQAAEKLGIGLPSTCRKKMGRDFRCSLTYLGNDSVESIHTSLIEMWASLSRLDRLVDQCQNDHEKFERLSNQLRTTSGCLGTVAEVVCSPINFLSNTANQRFQCIKDELISKLRSPLSSTRFMEKTQTQKQMFDGIIWKTLMVNIIHEFASQDIKTQNDFETLDQNGTWFQWIYDTPNVRATQRMSSMIAPTPIASEHRKTMLNVIMFLWWSFPCGKEMAIAIEKLTQPAGLKRALLDFFNKEVKPKTDQFYSYRAKHWGWFYNSVTPNWNFAVNSTTNNDDRVEWSSAELSGSDITSISTRTINRCLAKYVDGWFDNSHEKNDGCPSFRGLIDFVTQLKNYSDEEVC